VATAKCQELIILVERTSSSEAEKEVKKLVHATANGAGSFDAGPFWQCMHCEIR
jgi:hypothetical protein